MIPRLLVAYDNHLSRVSSCCNCCSTLPFCSQILCHIVFSIISRNLNLLRQFKWFELFLLTPTRTVVIILCTSGVCTSVRPSPLFKGLQHKTIWNDNMIATRGPGSYRVDHWWHTWLVWIDTHTAGCDHYIHTWCPYVRPPVPTFSKSSKAKQIFTAGRVWLA